MTARGLVALAGAFAACFVAIAIAVGTGRPAVDLAVATWMAPRRSALGVDACEVIAYLGSVVGLVPIGLLVMAHLQRRHGWKPVRWFALAAIGGSVLYSVTNVAFESARPPVQLRATDSVGWSFPSGHSTQAVAFWITAAVLVGAGRAPRARRILNALAVALVAITVASRIYLGVHWLMDVLGGLALGAFWVCVVLAIRRVRDRARVEPWGMSGR